MITYTVSQAAKELGISSRTLRRYSQQGKFIALTHVSGRLYYTQQMINDYLAGTYKPEKHNDYAAELDDAINIIVNPARMQELREYSTETETFYSIPNSSLYSSNCNILRRVSKKVKADIQYSIGYMSEGKFVPVITWSQFGLSR